jgi:hypothetical protein
MATKRHNKKRQNKMFAWDEDYLYILVLFFPFCAFLWPFPPAHSELLLP